MQSRAASKRTGADLPGVAADMQQYSQTPSKVQIPGTCLLLLLLEAQLQDLQYACSCKAEAPSTLCCVKSALAAPPIIELSSPSFIGDDLHFDCSRR